MTVSNPTDGEEPKNISLKLLLGLKPIAEPATSVGIVYLYPLRTTDMTDFEELEPADAANQLRIFLSSIASLTLESDAFPKRIPLDAAIAKALSGEEVEQLAEEYIKAATWQKREDDSQDIKLPIRTEDEAASSYLIRLIQHEIDLNRHAWKKLISSSGIFDQVHKSASALGSTLSEFEKLTKKPLESTLGNYSNHTDHLRRPNFSFVEQARELAEVRSEEMELTRLTGKMTAESAKALKDLVEAATTLMEQMDERDQRSDESTRKQIKIALWSVGSSAFLALIATVFAGFSYYQDKNNNSAGDQWQDKVLTAIERGTQQSFILERENQALLEQVKSQGALIANLEAAQRANAKTPRTAQ
ncbi:hypothetical protein [Deefgea salmonis]|uniref:Uncharacterized protein n=1 Tax=Deefgea salmonis TaxID=2875502 RepID=A0ABS8BL93_9NEIS|nr:hypothetical protein [Deefgea salmonis]MCB5196481.1 hypothetical protein [Deefgea salmonis]